MNMAAAYQSGSHQSVQGWLVLILVALAIVAYKRQTKAKPKTDENAPGKKSKPLLPRVLKVLGLKKKKSKKKGKKKSAQAPKTISRVIEKAEESLPAELPSDLAPFSLSKPSPGKADTDAPVTIPGVPGDLMRNLQKDAWTRMVREKKIPGLVWTGVEESPFGVRVAVKFEGVMNFPEAQSNIVHIEAGLDVKQGSVRPKPGSTAGRGFLEIRTKEPFAGGLLWEPPAGPVRLADPVHLATTPYGEKVYMSVKQRILISGTSGAGKSGTQRVVAAHVVLAVDANLELWDFKRVESTFYEGKARCVATVEEAADRITWLVETEYPRRMDLMVSRRLTDWQESPQDPALVIFVDEGSDLMRRLTPEQRDMLFSAVEKGRALGVFFVWATQFPKATNLPTELRSQFNAKACMRLESAKESRVVLDPEDVDAGWAPHLIDPYWVLIKDRDNKSPQEARVLELEDKVFGALSPAGPCPPDTVPCPEDTVPETGDMSLEEDIMLHLMMSPGPLSGRALASQLGRPKSTVDRAVDALIQARKLTRDESGLRMNSAPGE